MNQPTASSTNPLADAGEEGGSREIVQSALRLWRLVVARQETVLWIVAGCFAAGIAYYAVAPRYYRSEARLMVIEQNGDEPSTLGEQAGGDSMMTNQKELVRSHVVVRRAIDQLKPEHRVDLLDEPPHKWV
ncbi:MAG: Wzz/FepE/Etk N-terminal domain-containing protein, partial [Planctomycetota bacterium]